MFLSSSAVVGFVILLCSLVYVIIGYLKISRNVNFSVMNIVLLYPTDEDFFAKDVKSVKK